MPLPAQAVSSLRPGAALTFCGNPAAFEIFDIRMPEAQKISLELKTDETLQVLHLVCFSKMQASLSRSAGVEFTTAARSELRVTVEHRYALDFDALVA